MGYSIVKQKHFYCDPNKPELPSSPDNVKHVVNFLELNPKETDIVKTGIIDGSRIRWAKSASSSSLFAIGFTWPRRVNSANDIEVSRRP